MCCTTDILIFLIEQKNPSKKLEGFFLYIILRKIRNYIMQNTNYDYLKILEDFIESEHFPNNLVITKINYKTDEDIHDKSVMVYIPISQEVYENFEKYINSFNTSFDNFITNYDEGDSSVNRDEYAIEFTTLADEPVLVIQIVDDEMVFEGIGWDPSMSNLGTEPWNQTSFLEENIDNLKKLEDKLGYSDDILEKLYNDNDAITNAFENELQSTYNELYNDTFTSDYDPDAGEKLASDIYIKISNDVTNRIGIENYTKIKKELNKTLFEYLIEHNLDTFKVIYDKYINALNETTNEDIVPVQDGEVVKIQKPKGNTFSNKETNSDGIVLGTCDNCGAENVNIEDHICKTIVNNPNEMQTTIEGFKTMLENKQFGIDGEADYQSTRLLSKYGIDAIEDVVKMFKDYKGKDIEDAIQYVIDIIYDSEDIEDDAWKYIEPKLKEKIKEKILNHKK